MLRLRLAAGLHLPTLWRDWHTALDEPKLAFCRRLAREGLARFNGETLALTPRGMLVQNSILCELL